MRQDGEAERQRDGVTTPVSPLPPSLIPSVSPSSQTVSSPPNEARNFWILIVYQIVLRAGWIFKTESVVMPHAADALDPTGLARGWLPLLNRFGQSVPPVLAARHVKNLPKKQRAFMTTTAAMTLCFLGLTSLWLIPGAAGHRSAAVLFLVLYALFFSAIGVNQLSATSIQGKHIPHTQRGRLPTIADL